jgi:hypothetical protein
MNSITTALSNTPVTVYFRQLAAEGSSQTTQKLAIGPSILPTTSWSLKQPISMRLPIQNFVPISPFMPHDLYSLSHFKASSLLCLLPSFMFIPCLDLKKKKRKKAQTDQSEKRCNSVRVQIQTVLKYQST